MIEYFTLLQHDLMLKVKIRKRVNFKERKGKEVPNKEQVQQKKEGLLLKEDNTSDEEDSDLDSDSKPNQLLFMAIEDKYDNLDLE